MKGIKGSLIPRKYKIQQANFFGFQGLIIILCCLKLYTLWASSSSFCTQSAPNTLSLESLLLFLDGSYMFAPVKSQSNSLPSFCLISIRFFPVRLCFCFCQYNIFKNPVRLPCMSWTVKPLGKNVFHRSFLDNTISIPSFY